MELPACNSIDVMVRAAHLASAFLMAIITLERQSEQTFDLFSSALLFMSMYEREWEIT